MNVCKHGICKWVEGAAKYEGPLMKVFRLVPQCLVPQYLLEVARSPQRRGRGDRDTDRLKKRKSHQGSTRVN